MHGPLVIADISGYTQFPTDMELEHAHGIIGELLNSVIGAIHAPLTVSNIEGDAVFLYGTLPEGMSGQTAVESVELLYTSFAQALETMILNTTCKCNACANINILGLKIVMHCGEYVKTEIGGRETLSGPDVILAHRLLKNTIRETIGIADYMFISQACVDDLGVQGMVGGWIVHVEEYEHVGKVKGYVSSLPDVWAFVRQQNEDKVLQRDAWLSSSVHSKAPPPIVWDHLINPDHRTVWMEASGNETVDDSRGRIGPGSEYHCAHGDDDDIAIFTILDMKLLEYMTTTVPIDGRFGLRFTDYLIPSGTGTRLVTYAAPAFDLITGEPLPEEMLSQIMEPLREGYLGQVERLVAMADETSARHTNA